MEFLYLLQAIAVPVSSVWILLWLYRWQREERRKNCIQDSLIKNLAGEELLVDEVISRMLRDKSVEQIVMRWWGGVPSFYLPYFRCYILKSCLLSTRGTFRIRMQAINQAWVDAFPFRISHLMEEMRRFYSPKSEVVIFSFHQRAESGKLQQVFQAIDLSVPELQEIDPHDPQYTFVPYESFVMMLQDCVITALISRAPPSKDYGAVP